MEKYKCKDCEKEYDKLYSLLRHSSQKHNMTSEECYIHYELNGVKPTCICGCGESVGFISITKGFSRFVQSHHNRVNNNFQKNPETKLKSAKTQSENWKKGLYKGWWENDNQETKDKIESIKEKLRNDKERGRKISNSLKGKIPTIEHRNNLSKSQLDNHERNPNLRIEQSKIRLRWMKDNSKVKTSKLEITFEKILNNIGLVKDTDYTHSFLIDKIKSFFDFHITNKNILIEVDGDFYHCNPNTIHATPIYDIQKKNIINDKRKNTYCQNNNIKLLRFWEKDINERPEWVTSELMRELL